VTPRTAFYEGTVRHRRHTVRERTFRHRISMAYIDLGELPDVLDGRLARRFRRADFLGDPAVPLDRAVRARVAAATGETPGGPIGVLTQLRAFGHCFNPVSFYYCHRPDGTLHSVVAEVTNTPWGERSSYVLLADGAGPVEHGAFTKALHVSPFMPMDQHYVWSTTRPGPGNPMLSVHIASAGNDDDKAFDATLKLRRRPLSRRALARHAASTLKVLPLIYAHALVLAVRRVPVHPHPTPEVNP
jgi:uncharacterized protein